MRKFRAMKSILIIEPHWEGHHLKYAYWIARETAAQGYEVLFAASTDCLKHPLFQELQAEYTDQIRAVTLPGDGGKPDVGDVPRLIRLEFRYRRMFAECYRQLSSRNERPSYVFIPYLDYCVHAVSLLGSPFGDTPWGGIIIRPSFHLKEIGVEKPYSRLESVKKHLFLRLLRDKTLRLLFALDETLVHYVNRSKPALTRSLRFLPEPAELEGSHSRESARRMLGILDSATVVLVYGALDYTKGIDALITGVEQAPEETCVLLAGRQDAEVKALLASSAAKTLRKSGRLYEVDRFLYGEDEQVVFQASDIAWLGYRDQYISSGVLIQAAMMGLPIVACAEGLICWQTRSYDLGLTVPIEDRRTVAGAISTLARDKELSAKLGENGKQFSSAHSVERFGRVISEEFLANFPVDKSISR